MADDDDAGKAPAAFPDRTGNEAMYDVSVDIIAVLGTATL
ncbi:MAG: flagellar motor switch protein FliN, partial [Chloroflexi bacterium]|nr:flagellar motor switch protein FliN [Chloroflexota bacterium]